MAYATHSLNHCTAHHVGNMFHIQRSMFHIQHGPTDFSFVVHYEVYDPPQPHASHASHASQTIDYPLLHYHPASATYFLSDSTHPPLHSTTAFSAIEDYTRLHYPTVVVSREAWEEEWEGFRPARPSFGSMIRSLPFVHPLSLSLSPSNLYLVLLTAFALPLVVACTGIWVARRLLVA